MEIVNERIDSGKAFDWGKNSNDYAKYRDVYPEEFYKRIVDRGLCVRGQKALDLGTGTGVLPRNMYRYGASWTATDISPEQIEQARTLAGSMNMNVNFLAVPTEQMKFPDASFDVITACQCFWYFDPEKTAPLLSRLLKERGKLLILYMAWLPFKDHVAGKSEQLVLKFNPKWSGAGETKRPIPIPDVFYQYFEMEEHEEYELTVPFTRETWHGRMRACRGVGASLTAEELEKWDAEHRAMLKTEAPDMFEVAHYAALAIMRKK